MERYTLDPYMLSMDRFYELTASKKLLPGRVALQDMMEDRFRFLIRGGINNMGELLSGLNSERKIQNTVRITGIPEEYLILLRREARSYMAQPFPLSDFPGIPFEYVEVLKSRAIRNTKDFFENVQTGIQQKEIGENTGIPEIRLKELYVLCNLSRIPGIGGVFARIIYEANVRSLEDFVNTKPILQKYGYAAGRITEKDLHYCIGYATVILENFRENIST